MGIFKLFLIAIGLSMDSFAVSVSKGLNMNKINYKHSFIIALFFGLFQGIMPLIGYALGTRFASYIISFDHWVAFALLGIIGGKMIFESFSHDDENNQCSCKLDIKELFILAIATSIDALAVGITFSFLSVNILSSVILIGITTFILSTIGIIIGNNFGSKYQNKAEFAGGFILILIGIKILLEHLNIIKF